MKNKLIKVLILAIVLCVISLGIMIVVASQGGEKEKPHEHTYASEWTAVGDYHWKATTCGCDEKKDYVKHTIDENSVCTVCNSIVTSRNGVYYQLSNDLTYAIAVGSTETESEIVIEDLYLGVPVTSIAEKAFANSKVIESVAIHAGITDIGERAFNNCEVLSQINVSEENPVYKSIDGDLYTIDGKTIIQYASGKQQESVIVDSNVEIIAKYAYSYCSAIKTVEIGSNVKSIGHDAFYASGLTNITIPNSVTNLGGGVFAWNTSLEYVSIGSGVVSQEDNWFRNCYSIKNIEVSSPNKLYCSKNGSLYTKDGKKLIQYACANEKDGFIIPSGVEKIGDYALAYSFSLISVEIPDSVTTIGENAFTNCENLKNIVVSNNVTNIGSGAFSNCELLKKIIIPSKVEVVGANAFAGCKDLTVYCETDEEPNEWHADWNAFGCPIIWGFVPSEGLEYNLRLDGNYEVSSLGECGDADIIIPSTYRGKKVIAIADGAFEGCNMINSITIPNSVMFIGDRAFYDCSSILTIEIPSVKSVGDSVFEGCSSLENVIISSSLEVMGNNVFYRCKSLKSIEVDGENQYYKSIDGNLFTADEKTLIQYAASKEDVSYVVPNSVENISQMAFADCSKLTSVVISDSVKSIGEYAFYNCYSLTVLTIGANVEQVANTAFYDCYKLVEVYDKSNSIDSSYFANVLNIYTNSKGSKLSYNKDFIIYTSGAKKILVGYQGTKTEFEIPSGITEIGAYAFYNNQSIVSVSISKTVTSVGDSAFYNCNKLESITFGANVSSIGVSAFEDCALLREVILNDGLNSVGDKAFASCYSLESIIIPQTVRVMGSEAFSLCPKLSTIYCKADQSWTDTWPSDWSAKTDAQIIYGYVD